MLGAGEDERPHDSLPSRSRRSSVARLSVLPTNITDCSTRSAVVTAGAIETRTGSTSMLRASVSTAGGIVAEKRSVCRSLGQGRDDAPDVVDEAHVEHAVGLVEDEVRDAVEAHEPLLHEIEQAARRGDEDVGLLAERDLLPVLAHAAVDDGVAKALVAAVGGDALGDLRGELARRREDEPADVRCPRGRRGAGGSAARTRPSCRCRSARSRGRHARRARGG